jgi:hypothetical protein
MYLSANAFYGSSAWTYRQTDFAAQYYQLNGAHVWRTAPSGTAGNAITFTQPMTLDASGRLLLGATSVPDSGLSFYNSNGTVGLGHYLSASVGYMGTWTNHPFAFATNGTERARITSGGDLLVGCTAFPSSTVPGTAIFLNGPNGGAITIANNQTGAFQYVMNFINGNGDVGRIDTSGSSTSYVTSSDYRLKNNIAPMTGALAKVALLKPCTYKWNVDGSDGQGFIAHELAEVCPQAVSGEKDAVNEDGSIKAQGIDTSFLVATLTAAMQEQQAIIESLKARLDAANL